MKILWRFSARCGKRSFRSELDAQLALVRANRRARDGTRVARDKVEVRHYYCRRCDGWHLTSERRRTKD